MIDLIKTILISLFLVTMVFFSPSYSKEIDRQQATKVALNFVQSKNRDKDREISIDKTIPILYNGVVVNYLLTLRDSGFVFLSADDNSKPILAYSLENNYVKDNPHQQVLVEYYSKSVYQIKKEKIENDKFREEWKLLLEGSIDLNKGKSVAPLTVTKWGQQYDYNQFCPYDESAGRRVPTGCGTVAISQYLYFYQYPVHGKGIQSYIPSKHPEYGEQTVDFSKAKYEWSEMDIDDADTCNARLLYNVAVGAHANFDTGGTWLHPQDVVTLFRDFIGYSDQTARKFRDDVTEEEWNAYMTNELDNNRIVLYHGYSTSNAHYFILDGYDSADHFHINWGWYGSSNNWYYLNSLVTHNGAHDWAFRDNQVFEHALPKQDIQIIYPNGNEILQKGGSYTVEWEEYVADSVVVTLTKSGSEVKLFQDYSSKSGFLNWTVPSDFASGSDYKIKIEGWEKYRYSTGWWSWEWRWRSLNIFKESDNYFEIKEPDQEIVVTSLIPAIGFYTINEMDSLAFSLAAYDPDGETLTYSWKVDGVESSTDSLYIFKTNYDSQGIYEITLDVTDGYYVTKNSLHYQWNLRVKDVDQEIVINDLYPADLNFIPIDQQVFVGDTLKLYIDAEDPDGKELVFNWKQDSELVAVDSFYNFIADSNSNETYAIELTVSDNFEDALLFNDDFESGIFSSSWLLEGDQDWQITDAENNNGSYSAKSGTITDNQQTDMILTLEMSASGEIAFFKKVSSESGAGNGSFYDGLYFYIDDVEMGKWQGEVSWSESFFKLAAGSHILKWSYRKDAGAAAGSDCAWIDDIFVTEYGSGGAKSTIVKNWLITVQEVADQPPVITPISDQSLVEGELLSLIVSAEDSDGDTVSYFPGTGFASGMNLDSLSGSFSWQTGYLDSGTYNLEIIAKSGMPQLADTAYFNITVNNAVPQIPANLIVTVNDSIVEFSWDEEVDVQYKVISSGDAYSDKNGWFVEEILDSGAVWQDTVHESYKCYSIASILGDTSSDYCQSVGYRSFFINTENFTMVSLPFDTDISTAQEFISILNGNLKGGAETISRWENGYGQWQQCLSGFSTTDFAVEQGGAYMLYNADDNSGRFIISGDISTPASFDITADDFTLISVPLNRSDIFNASSLAEAIGGEDGGDVESISKWDPVLKEWKQYIVGSPLSDFDLSFGDGVLIYKLTPLAGWNSTKLPQPVLYGK